MWPSWLVVLFWSLLCSLGVHHEGYWICWPCQWGSNGWLWQCLHVCLEWLLPNSAIFLWCPKFERESWAGPWNWMGPWHWCSGLRPHICQKAGCEVVVFPAWCIWNLAVSATDLALLRPELFWGPEFPSKDNCCREQGKTAAAGCFGEKALVASLVMAAFIDFRSDLHCHFNCRLACWGVLCS